VQDLRLGSVRIYQSRKDDGCYILSKEKLLPTEEDHLLYRDQCQQRQKLDNENVLRLLHVADNSAADGMCSHVHQMRIYFEFYVNDLRQKLE
jgi:hypothetical protein